MDDDRPLNHTMELRELVNFEGVAVVPSTKGVNLDSSSLLTWTMKASMVVVLASASHNFFILTHNL